MPHLDLIYLVDNVTSDQDFINTLLGVFLSSLEGDVGDLEKAINEGDHGRIRRAAHKVKSSFRSLGMHLMTERLQALENMGRDEKDLHTIKQAFEDFLADLPEVKTEVNDYINSNTAR